MISVAAVSGKPVDAALSILIEWPPCYAFPPRTVPTLRSHFPAAVTYFGSQHERIPPGAHTYQSAVETLHRLIEDEFFDLETFSNRADFLARASLYRLYFNLARPNSHKRGLTPWQIIHQLAPRLPLNLCSIPPVFLDYRLDAVRRDDRPTPKGGYDLPRLP